MTMKRARVIVAYLAVLLVPLLLAACMEPWRPF